MGNKIFVGGLAWATTDDSLRQAFEQCGQVLDAKVVMDRETGRSRGFGFVTFADDNACQNAIEQMDGKNIDGRTVRVNQANESPRGGGGGGGGGGRSFGGPREGGGGGGGGRGGFGGPREGGGGGRGGDRGGDRGGRQGNRW